MSKIIHVHGPDTGYDVDVEEYRTIIDSNYFQRLRNINQLDFNFIAIYPDVRHTRFSHSLGVLEHERRIINAINSRKDDYKFSDLEAATTKLAALLHDIKHSPGSHGVEKVLETFDEPNHDIKAIETLYALEQEIKKISNVDFRILIEIFKREHPLYQTIWSLVGSDVLHYLNNDATMAGLNPITDVNSIITHAVYDGEKYGVMFKKREVVRAHVGAYINQYLTFYNAKACALMKGLLRRGTYETVEAGLKPSKIWDMNDIELAIAMNNSGPIGRKILHRILYRENAQAFLTIKIEGQETFEDVGDKFNKVFTLPEKDLTNIVEYFENINHVIEFERSLEKALHYEPGDITLAEMPHIKMLKAKDVNLQKISGEWVTLFTVHKSYRKYKEEFDSGVEREYALRVGVPGKRRENAYKHSEEVFDVLCSFRKLSVND